MSERSQRDLLRFDGPRCRVILRDPYQFDSPTIEAEAIIDTGSTYSGVDESIVEYLGLANSGTANLVKTTESQTVRVYRVTVLLSDGEQELEAEIPVTSGVYPEERRFKVILGRDILSCCDFVYHGAAGQWKLSILESPSEIEPLS